MLPTIWVTETPFAVKSTRRPLAASAVNTRNLQGPLAELKRKTPWPCTGRGIVFVVASLLKQTVLALPAAALVYVIIIRSRFYSNRNNVAAISIIIWAIRLTTAAAIATRAALVSASLTLATDHLGCLVELGRGIHATGP